jgi:hypothetical protein
VATLTEDDQTRSRYEAEANDIRRKLVAKLLGGNLWAEATRAEAHLGLASAMERMMRTTDEGSPPCACNTAQCSACPDGWQGAQTSQVDLCCHTGKSGATECFSQSTQVQGPAEGSSITGGPWGCDDYKSASGHVYEILCDTTKTPQCTCSLDGTITQTFAFKDGCGFSSCGFPQ